MSLPGRIVALPVLATIFAMAAYQIGAAVAKGLFPAVGPQGAATLRLCMASVVLLAIVRPWRAWPRRSDWPALVGLGISMAGAIICFFSSIERLPLGVAIAVQFLGPLSIAVFGSKRRMHLLWAVLAGIGVWCLVGVGARTAALDPIGLVWSLGSAICWAGYILFGRAASFSGPATGAIATTIAALLILPVGVNHAGIALLDMNLLPLAVVVGVFSTALPFSLELYALPRMPARTFAVLMSLEPAFAVLAGLILLHERLAGAQILGIAIVIAAAAGAAVTSQTVATPD